MDDLVKRLRTEIKETEYSDTSLLLHEAANRIEELEAELADYKHQYSAVTNLADELRNNLEKAEAELSRLRKMVARGEAGNAGANQKLRAQNARLRETLPNDLREEGWAVAIHNDYWLAGERKTFWLVTHRNGRWLKGEGATDAEALNEIRKAKAALGDSDADL